MSIRREAIRWLDARGGARGGHVVTSKYYRPAESWTGADAWWLQVPATAVKDGRTIHLLCEAAPGAAEFRHLRVPAAYLQAHLDDFAILREDKINLFLSAEPASEFQDQRGPGRVEFAQFEQP